VIDEYGLMVELYWQGKTGELGEKPATLSTTNPTWIDPGTNPGVRGERPATNDLSHGTTPSQISVLKNIVSVEYMRKLQIPFSHDEFQEPG
jgi:hypothetical protein